MTHAACRLTAKNRNQLQNPVLGNRVWATFFNPNQEQMSGWGQMSGYGRSGVWGLGRQPVETSEPRVPYATTDCLVKRLPLAAGISRDHYSLHCPAGDVFHLRRIIASSFFKDEIRAPVHVGVIFIIPRLIFSQRECTKCFTVCV